MRLSQFSAIEASFTSASWKVEAPNLWAGDQLGTRAGIVSLGPLVSPPQPSSPPHVPLSRSTRRCGELTDLVAGVAGFYHSTTGASVSGGQGDCCVEYRYRQRMCKSGRSARRTMISLHSHIVGGRETHESQKGEQQLRSFRTSLMDTSGVWVRLRYASGGMCELRRRRFLLTMSVGVGRGGRVL